ncbi:MAG: hypothetical protein O2816_05705 [Planctomycetota bacterium]|nr:hypothetical protein [Planctomycetota bacterium]
MNTKLLIAGLTSALALTCISNGLFGGTPGAGPPSDGPHLKGIRAEYEDLAGNWPHTDTICYVVNKSLTQPLRVEQVTVLGPGGRSDVLGVYPGVAGRVLEPLEELRLFIDDSIPGVVPQLGEEDHGVRSVLVEWYGPTEALRLSGTILREPHSVLNDPRTTIVVHGYDLNE